MKKYFVCNYELEDGYVGASRPQKFKIYANQINERLSKADLKELFGELLYEDFQSKVEPVSDDMEAFLEWAQDILKEEKDDEDWESEDNLDD